MFKFKKSFGQNFLQDKAVLQKIVGCSSLTSEDFVLEIGPGDGAMTTFLLDRSNYVVAVEKDFDLLPILSKKFGENKSFRLIHEDFLKLDLKSVADKKMKVIANIPYNITSPIISKLISNRDVVDSIFLTVQKEVAERIVAQPGDKNRSLLSISVQLYADPTLEFVINRDCFYPVPDVDSALISMKFHSKYSFKDNFMEVARALFSQKRKQILNNLSRYCWDKDKWREVLTSIDIDFKERAEDLSIEEIGKISEVCYAR